MSEKREANVKAGAFVLISIGIFVAFLVVLLGRGLFRVEKTYYTVFDHSVQGLDKGSPVKYLGVPAGAVSDIRFEPGSFPKIRVTMKVKDYIPIKEGTRAMFVTTALTGIGSVELVGGSNEEQELSDGARIPEAPSFYMKLFETIPVIMERLPGVLERIEKASANIETLFRPENQTKITGALTKLEETVGTLQRSIEATAESVRKDLSEATNTLREEFSFTAQEARNALREAREELKGLSGKVSASWEKLDRAIGRLDLALARGDRLLGDSLAQLRDALRETEALVGELRRDPARLLFSSPLPERAIPEPQEK